MAIFDRNTLKTWFSRGLKPTQEQFWNWIDSFWHKQENIPAANIEGLQGLLDAKANSAALALKADEEDLASLVERVEDLEDGLRTSIVIGNSSEVSIEINSDTVRSITANGATLSITITENVPTGRVAELTLKISCANSSGTTITWTGCPSTLWADGDVLENMADGEVVFVAFMATENGIEIINKINRG